MVEAGDPGDPLSGDRAAACPGFVGWRHFGKTSVGGIGSGFVPSICRLDLADEIMAVSDEDAFETGRRLARAEGVFSGTSSGANVWAAIRRAKALGPGKKIVTIAADSGLKYLNGKLYRG